MISKSFVTHHFLEEHDIHEFIFSKTSRAAVDEYFDFIREIYDQHLKGRQKAFIILDIHESSMLPVKYARIEWRSCFRS